MLLFILKLVLSHVLGDFIFQPLKWVKDKEKKKHKSVYLYLHITIHAIILLLFLPLKLEYIGAILLITVTHFIIDLLKLNLSNSKNSKLLFVVDQFLHLIVLAAVAHYFFRFSINITADQTKTILLAALALTLTTAVSGIIMKVALGGWEISEDKNHDSLKNAGLYIGMLERLFIFLFIILHQWQAIGFLIAAKSIFRFSDLSRAKDRKLTEYVLIGTLLSYGLAILIGFGYLALKN
ncbi:MAG: hypothetical protein ACI81S_000590 [Sphingobacteriales bacterium]|jgi:hypothetical protein